MHSNPYFSGNLSEMPITKHSVHIQKQHEQFKSMWNILATCHFFPLVYLIAFLMSWLSGLAEGPSKWKPKSSVCMLMSDRHKLERLWERSPLMNSCCAMCMTMLERGKAGVFLINDVILVRAILWMQLWIMSLSRNMNLCLYPPRRIGLQWIILA